MYWLRSPSGGATTLLAPAPDPGSATTRRPLPRKPRHSVYVVRLDDAVLEDRKFRDANPDRVGGKPCVYVGMTGLTPDQRFANHKAGIQSNKYVQRYGKHLIRPLYRHLNPMPYGQAVEWEVKLAESLRRRGYAVWQH